jgi:hypothetical protein
MKHHIELCFQFQNIYSNKNNFKILICTKEHSPNNENKIENDSVQFFQQAKQKYNDI